jgi:hypothetical protein
MWQAKQNGQLLEKDLDGVPLRVWGGIEEQRGSAMDAAVADLTTQRGQDMLATLQNRTGFWGDVKPFDIILIPGGTNAAGFAGTVSMPGSDFILVGTNTIGSYDSRILPGEEFGWERVIAHEFGHSILGIQDEWVNVVANENLIMQQLGDPNKRIAY